MEALHGLWVVHSTLGCAVNLLTSTEVRKKAGKPETETSSPHITGDKVVLLDCGAVNCAVVGCDFLQPSKSPQKLVSFLLVVVVEKEVTLSSSNKIVQQDQLQGFFQAKHVLKDLDKGSAIYHMALKGETRGTCSALLGTARTSLRQQAAPPGAGVPLRYEH